MAVQPTAQEEVPSNDAVLDAASLSDTEYLAKLGYKQELKRDLGLFSAFGVQFSSIAVTSSMYTTLVVGLLFFGPASFWSWVIGGTLQVFAVGLAVAELVSAYPLAGGVYQINNRILRAVVVGGELVSWSAVVTLREAGARTVLMTTRYPSPESYAAFNIGGRAALRVSVSTRTRIVRVIGRPRVEAVEIENLDTGNRRLVGCDTVVFTGDWIPDHELARLAGIELDPGTRGPLTDTALRTSRPGTFAAGNLLHPVDTADIAALDGRHVADQVIAWLDGRRPDPRTVRLRAQKPFRWVAPGLLRPGDPAPARRRLLLWTDDLVHVPHVTATQAGRVIGMRRLPWPSSPGRVFRVPWSLLSHIDPGAGDVTIGLYAPDAREPETGTLRTLAGPPAIYPRRAGRQCLQSAQPGV